MEDEDLEEFEDMILAESLEDVLETEVKINDMKILAVKCTHYISQVATS